MRPTFLRATLMAVVCALVAAPTLAAQHGGATKHAVATTHGPKATTTTTKAPTPKGPTVKATTPTKAHTTKATKSPAAKATTTKTTNAKASTSKGATKKAGASSVKKTSTTPTSSATSTGTTSTSAGASAGTWKPNNPIAEKLSTKPNLLNKVQTTLPAGTDLNAATAGFKNFGQFVAAVNVSNNLGVPFADLRSAMTGTALDGTSTGVAPVSLGQAIQQLRPGVDAEVEAQKAQTQATQQIGATTPTTTTTTKSKGKSAKRGNGGSL